MPVDLDRRQMFDRTIDSVPDCIFDRLLVGREEGGNRPAGRILASSPTFASRKNTHVNIRDRVTRIFVLFTTNIPLPKELGPVCEVDILVACDCNPLKTLNQVAS